MHRSSVKKENNFYIFLCLKIVYKKNKKHFLKIVKGSVKKNWSLQKIFFLKILGIGIFFWGGQLTTLIPLKLRPCWNLKSNKFASVKSAFDVIRIKHLIYIYLFKCFSCVIQTHTFLDVFWIISSSLNHLFLTTWTWSDCMHGWTASVINSSLLYLCSPLILFWQSIPADSGRWRSLWCSHSRHGDRCLGSNRIHSHLDRQE